MSDQFCHRLKVQYVFKLRSNITLEGDLALARMELASFFPDPVTPVRSLSALGKEFPCLAGLKGVSALDSFVRPDGTQAFRARGSLSLLPNLIRRLSFVQRIYCLGRRAASEEGWLSTLAPGVRAVMLPELDDNDLLIQAIPHYALFELSDVVARRSQSPTETRRNLDVLMSTLLQEGHDRRAQGVVRAALTARSTSSQLFHGIHYYKAKFFPRLVRSVLTAYAKQLGDERCRVLDPFVGSGTTLLEAAIMGLPSVGVDLDPLSALISRTKVDAGMVSSEQLFEASKRAIEQLEQLDARRSSDDKIRCEPVRFPAWLLKNRKMTAEVALELGREIGALQTVVATCAPEVRSLFRVLVSDAIARRVRMRFLGTGVGRFSLSFSQATSPDIFVRSMARAVNTVVALEWIVDTLGTRRVPAEVVQGDARSLPVGLGLFDLILTSPPYLPASSGRESYARSRALSLIALGLEDHRGVDHLADKSVGSMDDRKVDPTSLTDAQHRVVNWLQTDRLRAPKARPTARYFSDMRRALTEMARVLRPGGIAVIVSGKQSTFYRFSTREPLYTVPTAELLAEEAERTGLKVDALHDVELSKANKNARPRSLDEYFETLIVLQKPG